MAVESRWAEQKKAAAHVGRQEQRMIRSARPVRSTRFINRYLKPRSDLNIKSCCKLLRNPTHPEFLLVCFTDLQQWATSQTFQKSPTSTNPSWRRLRPRRKTPCPHKKVCFKSNSCPHCLQCLGLILTSPLSFHSHRAGEGCIVKPLPSCTVHPSPPTLPCFSHFLLAV